MKLQFSVFALALLALVGCSGPATPFGAIDVFRTSTAEFIEETEQIIVSHGPQIRFFPQHQLLHDAVDFSLMIEDPEGVPEDFRLRLNYNGHDVTKQFLAHAGSTFMDSGRHRLKLSTLHLRLLASRENKIQVTYWRTKESSPVVAQYLPPSCSAFDYAHNLGSVPVFNPPADTVHMINDLAVVRNLNPNYVAGIIAQESAFNPQALSFRKALGLTQITMLGEAEVIKENPAWPRYPGINQMPLALVKLGIFDGAINANTEWRLNPALSIEGGVRYLMTLTDYWNRPERKAQIEKSLGPSDETRSEVILASYNSGSFRVSQAIDRSGKRWLDDDELGEAKTYVHRVVSFCDHFQNLTAAEEK